MHSVLIVDDNSVVRTSLIRGFVSHDFTIMSLESGGADSLAAARRILQSATPDSCLLDIRLPDGNGASLLAEIAPRGIRAVVFTGYASVTLTVELMRRGAFDVIPKPSPISRIAASLRGEFCDQDCRKIPQSKLRLSQLEREYIDETLIECRGNVSMAARLLGIHRQSLQRKIRKNTQA